MYVFLARTDDDPRLAGDWFHPEPILAKDVVDLRPGDEVVLSAADPMTLQNPPGWMEQIDVTRLRAQAVVRLNPWDREVGRGVGNAFSRIVSLAEAQGPVQLTCDQLVQETLWPESRYCRLFTARSPRMSEFHGRDVAVRGMVLLPQSYFDRPERRYPVLFEIPGFGGTAPMAITRIRCRNRTGWGWSFCE